MKRKDILQALDEISDARIEKAAQPPKKKMKKLYWYSGIAAVLAVAILLGIFLPTGKAPLEMWGSSPNIEVEPTGIVTGPVPTYAPTKPTAPSTPVAPTIPTKPIVVQPLSQSIAIAQYPEKGENNDVSKDIAGLNYYFNRTIAQFLQENQGNDNVTFSPMNLYMALAMLAETTDGETRAEILSLLGATDIHSLRYQANKLWLGSYQTGNTPCTLANSVWVQKGVFCNQGTMNTLAAKYFASVYGVDFSSTAGRAVADWIDKETAGMLKEHTAVLDFDPRTVMALASTIYLQADWRSPFDQKANTQDVFYGTNGQSTCTFMHKSGARGYYWGEDYSAVGLGLNGGYTMWFVLPDEGKNPADLLQSGHYSELLFGDSTNVKEVVVNLSLPKFDITCKQDMIEGLQDLGVKEVFQMGQADFTPAFPDMAKEIAVGKVEQATRVSVDEDGIEAASYVVIGAPGSGPPPTQEVDFVLDRPFLFFITKADMPLFAGVVNNP